MLRFGRIVVVLVGCDTGSGGGGGGGGDVTWDCTCSAEFETTYNYVTDIAEGTVCASDGELEAALDSATDDCIEAYAAAGAYNIVCECDCDSLSAPC